MSKPSNKVFFDINDSNYIGDFFFDNDRELAVCYFKSAERYMNDVMACEKKDISMSEVIKNGICNNVWTFIVKTDEKISDRIFKYSKDSYISFGFDRDNISRFLNKETDYLVMDFNCVDDDKNKDTDVVNSGYIPVEYNYYKELTEKAAKYDKIQDYISKMENKHADV